jgi:hypothetical protein
MYGILSYGFLSPDSVVRSTNNGITWTGINNNMRDVIIYHLILCGDDFYVATSNGIYHSTNEGNSWIPKNNGLKDKIGRVLLATDSIVYFSSGYGSYMTIDKGINWLPLIIGTKFNEVSVLTLEGSYMFAGTYEGVFRSSNNGLEWTPLNKGLGKTSIAKLIFHNSYVFAGTTTGVWRRNASEVMEPISNLIDEVPISFSLEQNYPNPFNTTTRIRYSISQDSYVTLTIFDFLGRKITTAVEGYKKAGTNDVAWDGSGMTSGIYFYRLDVGRYSTMKKFVLIK